MASGAITPGQVLGVYIGEGGTGGQGTLKQLGTDGKATSVVVSNFPAVSVVAEGGLHGASGVTGGHADSFPLDPFTFNGVTYPGVVSQIATNPAHGANGPGASGTGGVGGLLGGHAGGNGGPGKVWIRAYQLT
jgi:hypothetical protein